MNCVLLQGNRRCNPISSYWLIRTPVRFGRGDKLDGHQGDDRLEPLGTVLHASLLGEYMPQDNQGLFLTRGNGILLRRSTWFYKARSRDDSVIRKRIREIAQTRVRYGCQRIFTLLRREGWRDNHKRIHRLYRLEGLNLRS